MQFQRRQAIQVHPGILDLSGSLAVRVIHLELAARIWKCKLDRDEGVDTLAAPFIIFVITAERMN
jgi:hypothetical protein